MLVAAAVTEDDSDLIWIDRQLRGADSPHDADRRARLQAALIGPLRNVYGLSDKVLTMTLSCILLTGPAGLRDLAAGRRHHDRHRHPGAQLSASHRHLSLGSHRPSGSIVVSRNKQRRGARLRSDQYEQSAI